MPHLSHPCPWQVAGVRSFVAGGDVELEAMLAGWHGRGAHTVPALATASVHSSHCGVCTVCATGMMPRALRQLADARRARAPNRWDGARVEQFEGTYGAYLMRKQAAGAPAATREALTKAMDAFNQDGGRRPSLDLAGC